MRTIVTVRSKNRTETTGSVHGRQTRHGTTMASTRFKGAPVDLSGSFPAKGTAADRCGPAVRPIRITPPPERISISGPCSGDSARCRAMPRTAYRKLFHAPDPRRPDHRSSRIRYICTFSYLNICFTGDRPPSANRPDPTSFSQNRLCGCDNRCNRHAPRHRPSATA